MKKFIALAVVICMLIANCLMLSSCGKVSEKDFLKDPKACIGAALKNTMSAFFEDNMKLAQVLKNTVEKGSYGVYFESDDLMGGELTRIDATVYQDVKDQKSVVDIAAKYNGETLSARAYSDKNGIAVGSESVLGNSDVYALNYGTFIEKFKGSELSTLLYMDDETAAEMVKIVEEIQKNINAAPNTTADELKALSDELYAQMDPGVTSKKLETEGGKSVDCVVVTTFLYNENIKRIYNHVIDYAASKSEELTEDAKTELDEVIKEFDESVYVNLLTEIYVSKKTNKVEQIAVKGYIGDKTDGDAESLPVDLKVVFTDTNIIMDFNTVNSDDDSNVSVDITVNKEEKETENIYTFKIDAASGSVSLNVLNAKITVADNGDFSVEGDVVEDADEGTRYKASAKGNVKKEKDKITVEVTSVTYNSVTVSFKLGIVISAAEVPAMPQTTKDIVDITAEDVQNIMTDVQNSKLGRIIYEIEMNGEQTEEF